MIPLTTFLLLFQVKLGPISIRNPRKIGPESRKFFDQVFGLFFELILAGFGSRFGSQDEAKIDRKGCWENYEKTMTTKMAKDGLKWRTGVEKLNDRGSPRWPAQPFERARPTPWSLFLKEFDKLEFDKDYHTSSTHAVTRWAADPVR